VCGDGGGAAQRLRHGKPIVETPQEVRRDHVIERIHIALEQGAREALEQLVSLGG
jgi:hypothetical protein